jgi:DNA-binding response OmpR family regulator
MPGEESESSASTEASLQTILLVEDDEDIGAFLAEVLKQERPAAVLHLSDGAHALAAVKSIRPTLFILDYRLPGIDGLTLSDQLHAIEGYQTIPTLMISAENPPQRAMRERDIVFLPKPFDLPDLLNIIDRLLPQAEG